MSCFREIAPRSFSNNPCCRDSPPIFAAPHAPLPTNRPTKFTKHRHVEPSQRKTFIAPVSSGKTEGEIPSPIAGSQNRTFIFHRLVPFPSLASGSIAKPLRSFPELAPSLPSARHTDRPLPRALNKKQAELHTNKRRRSFPLASSAMRLPMWVGHSPMLRPISPSRQRRRGCQNGKRRMRPPNFDEKKEEEAEEEGMSGCSSRFVWRNEEKPGAFAE